MGARDGSTRYRVKRAPYCNALPCACVNAAVAVPRNGQQLGTERQAVRCSVRVQSLDVDSAHLPSAAAPHLLARHLHPRPPPPPHPAAPSRRQY